MSVYLWSKDLASYKLWQGGGCIFLGNCLVWPTKKYVPYVVNCCTLFYDSLSIDYPCVGWSVYICTLWDNSTINAWTWWISSWARCYCMNNCWYACSFITTSFRFYNPGGNNIYAEIWRFGTYWTFFTFATYSSNNNRLWQQTSYGCSFCFRVLQEWRHHYLSTKRYDGRMYWTQYFDGSPIWSNCCVTQYIHPSWCSCLKWDCWVIIADVIWEGCGRDCNKVLEYYNNSKARFNVG